MGFFDFLRRKSATPPEGNVAPASPPDPEWRYRQAYTEGKDQARYAAASKALEGQIQTPVATTSKSPEGGVPDTRPEWVQRESARIPEGYVREGIAQVPQAPLTRISQTPPSAGENKG